MTKTKERESSVKSIIIIILYFILPYIINFISSSNVFSITAYALFALLLIFLYKDTFIKDFKDIWENKARAMKTIVIGVIAIFLVTIFVNAIVQIVFDIKETSENDYSLLTMFKKSPLVLMLLTCLYYPVVEGIVFRKTIRDVIDNKWIFIIFSSLFYFFFNIVYTSMSFATIMSSICCITTMMILSYIYWKNNNFSITVIILMLYNLIISLISFL